MRLMQIFLKHLRKTGIKTVLLQSKHCPVCPDILCLPVPGEAMPMQPPSLGAHHHSWGHTGVLPTPAVSSLKGRQRCDCHPAGHLAACIGRTSLTLSLVNPGKAFIEQHKPLALELLELLDLLEPVFPRLGTTCLICL